MIPIAFRLDDPSPTSDHGLEARLLALFDRFGLPLSVAVVPYGRTRDGAPVAGTADNLGHLTGALRRGAIEILLHGHTHRNHRVGKGPPSEFAGRPRDEQRCLMQDGLAVLRAVFGDVVAGFVPPWNTCDAETLRAASDVGLAYVSAGFERWRGTNDALPVVPRTCTMRTARRALEQSLAFGPLEPALVVVMHPDDFREFRDPPAPGEDAGFTELAELEALLDFIAARRECFSPRFLGHMVAETERRWLPSELRWSKHVPWRLRARLPEHLLLKSTPVLALLYALTTRSPVNA